MDSNALTTVAPAAALEGARTAMQSLWDMLQDADGNPLSIDANDLLLTVYEQYEQIALAQQQADARIISLLEMIDSARSQRDDAVTELHNARGHAAAKAIRDLTIDMRLEFNLDPETPRKVLELLTGINDDLPYYLRNALRRALETIDQEVMEQRELDAAEAALGDPDDDYDPD
jgi:hypothetical protein